MRYHVICTDMAGTSRRVACCVSPEGAVCTRNDLQKTAGDGEMYWILPTTCCDCGTAPVPARP